MKKENMKPIPLNNDYLISCDGEVIWDKRFNKEVYQWVHEINGYKSKLTQLRDVLGKKRKHMKVHRLVCLTWVGQPPNSNFTDVNHKDGNSLNNHFNNLEWCTKSQNQRHAIKEGLKGKGEDLYNSQLTNKQVHEICQKLTEGILIKDLSKEYPVSKDILRKIKAGDTYFHIRKLYNIEHKYKHYYSISTVKWVCEKILEGHSDKKIKDLSTNKNITIIEIKRIREKIRYKSISDSYF